MTCSPSQGPELQCLSEETASVRPPGQAPPGESLQLQELVQRAEELRDPAARALVYECVQSLLGFYGEGLGRLLQVIESCGPEGTRVRDRLLGDRTICALLFIHGLHPVDLRTRLLQAIEKVRPYMESHGGNVELLGLEHEVARLRLQGTCKSCPSSTVTLELALRHAIEEACPDLLGFEVEGAETNAPEPVKARSQPNGSED